MEPSILPEQTASSASHTINTDAIQCPLLLLCHMPMLPALQVWCHSRLGSLQVRNNRLEKNDLSFQIEAGSEGRMTVLRMLTAWQLRFMTACRQHTHSQSS